MYNYILLIKICDTNKCKGGLGLNLLRKTREEELIPFCSGVFVTFDKFHPLKTRRKEPNILVAARLDGPGFGRGFFVPSPLL